MNFFGGTFFGGGFFGSVGVSGGKGDNRPRGTYKPTGLPPRKKLHLKKSPEVTERIEQTKEDQLEIAQQLYREFHYEPEIPIERMELVDIEREIGTLLRRKIRNEEEEIILLLLMAAASELG